MEGVAGIVDRPQCRGPGQPYEEGRRLLLGEVNAAIDGAVRRADGEHRRGGPAGGVQVVRGADLYHPGRRGTL